MTLPTFGLSYAYMHAGECEDDCGNEKTALDS